MVEAFQRSRGLPISGDVDATTWSRLSEAGWRLGQRLLFLTRPHLRGDDVAELQIRLAQLGFNPGRIDGIFGPLLDLALSDFQRNCGLPVDGTLTRSTLMELIRMTSVASERHLVTDAREQAGFDESVTGPLIVCGRSPLVALVAALLGPSFDVHVLERETPDQVASFANDRNAALVLSFQTLDPLNEIHLHYWASYHSHSHRGEQLAGEVASALARTHALPRVEVTGMALPILRETQMTTLHVEHGNPSDEVLAETAEQISRVLVRVFHR
jgi:N-acetylmuramoyl-L-alanine amidase